jgi:hypothetical protein
MSDPLSDRTDEQLRATFFRSVTLVTAVSGIILAGSEGVLFPAALTPIFAVLGWILVDHLRWLKLPLLAGNLLGMVALWIAASEFIGGTLERKLLSGAHLIVFLTWIVLLLPKGNRQYWWLIALSLLQVAISGVLSTGVSFGGAMVGMMALLLWTLSVFSLFRVQDHHAQRLARQLTPRVTHEIPPAQLPPRNSRTFIVSFLGLGRKDSAVDDATPGNGSAGRAILVRNGLQRDPSEVWVGWRFRWMVATSCLVSLVLALFVFAAFPRVWVQGATLFGDVAENSRGLRNRTGFSETVELGQLGRLMENNERVLAFDIMDLKTRKPVTAEAFADAMKMDEIRFRGNAFACYTEGKWTRGFVEKGFSPGEELHRIGDRLKLPSDFRISIVQDPPFGPNVFAPYPVSRIEVSGAGRIMQTEVSASLVWDSRTDSDSVSRVFVVECPRLDQNPEATFEYWYSTPDLGASVRSKTAHLRAEFTSRLFIMDGLEGRLFEQAEGEPDKRSRRYSKQNDLKITLPRLYQAARVLCSENGTLCDMPERIRRIVNYLSNANGFVYSLQQDRSDRSLDPIEDFLFNTRSGHCEYFASACTLMLQAVEVPARMINGYYGSELNPLTGKNEIRQRHAHTWVEAFVDDLWQTVEPTPSAERRDSLTSTGSISLMSNLQTAISDLWNDGIHRMSAERQQQFFAPVIESSKSLLRTIQERGILTMIKLSVADFLKSPDRWVSWQGGVVTFLLMLFGVLLARLHIATHLARWLHFLRDNLSTQRRTSRSVIRFYEGFCFLCERNGLAVHPSRSALENARLAMQAFESRLPSPELRDVPIRIAHAFNGVRFGHVTLTNEQATEIGNDLNAFAKALEARRKTT